MYATVPNCHSTDVTLMNDQLTIARTVGVQPYNCAGTGLCSVRYHNIPFNKLCLIYVVTYVGTYISTYLYLNQRE